MPVSFDFTNVLSFMTNSEFENISEFVKQAHNQLHQQTGPGSDYLGWIDWPINYDKEEFLQVKLAAERIQQQSDALIVIGIGGSYLGSKAAIEALSHTFHNQVKGNTEVYFAGHNISPTYITHLLQLLEGKDISINVISKSGTTTEPALAFRIFRTLLEKSMEKKKLEIEFMSQPTGAKARFGILQLKKDTKHLSFLIISEDDTPF